MVACLKQLKDKKLVTAVSKLFLFASTMPFAPFAPVVEKQSEGAFLTENPYKLLKEGRLVNDVPWVASNTADEGLFAVACKFLDLPKKRRLVPSFCIRNEMFNTKFPIGKFTYKILINLLVFEKMALKVKFLVVTFNTFMHLFAKRITVRHLCI